MIYYYYATNLSYHILRIFLDWASKMLNLAPHHHVSRGRNSSRIFILFAWNWDFCFTPQTAESEVPERRLTKALASSETCGGVKGYLFRETCGDSLTL